VPKDSSKESFSGSESFAPARTSRMTEIGAIAAVDYAGRPAIGMFASGPRGNP
jgi:hypothetical protein